MTQVLTDEPQLMSPEQPDLPGPDAFSAAEEIPPGDAEERVDVSLRDVVPPPVLLSSTELADEVAGRRILILKQEASVPVSVILVIFGSLLFHAFFAGLFFIAFFIAVKSTGDLPGWSAEPDEGGGSGYMLAGTGPQGDPAISGDVLNVLGKAATMPPPPSLDKPSVAAELNPLAQLPASPPVNLIGTPQNASDFGTPKFTPPKLPTPPVPTGIDVTNITAVASAQPTKIPDARPNDVYSGRTGEQPGSPVAGGGSGGSDQEEEVIDIFKPGKGGTGSGKGKGSGRGDGIDRGASGANRNNPQPVATPMPEIPLQMRFSRPDRAIKFELLVEADGTVSKITMVQSCGQPEIDSLYKAAVAKWKFAPALVAGRPIAKIFEASFTFGTAD